MTETSLTGKVAVVTGAGAGLGRAYAVALGVAGATVVVNDANSDGAEETVRLIEQDGGGAVAAVASVGSSEVADALVMRAVDEFGRLDLMVTNAGILRDKVLWKMTDEDFDLVLDTHLKGTFTCARAAAVRFREQDEGGRIVVVGSPAGQRGNFGQTNYAAAKAGIVAFARTWAMELARARVTVNAIVPTAWTQMTATIPIYASVVELAEAGRPLPAELRRAHAIGYPADSAGLVVFLASDAADGITGQAIGIGGDKLSLWSHPVEAASAFCEGGWSPESIAEAWLTTVGAATQSIGLNLPPLAFDGSVEGVVRP